MGEFVMKQALITLSGYRNNYRLLYSNNGWYNMTISCLVFSIIMGIQYEDV